MIAYLVSVECVTVTGPAVTETAPEVATIEWLPAVFNVTTTVETPEVHAEGVANTAAESVEILKAGALPP